MRAAGFATMLAAGLASFAIPTAAMQTPNKPPPPAAETADESEIHWRTEMNAAVAKANHWRWRLRFLERRGDTLTVGVSFRNGGSTARPIYLDSDYMETVALVDQTNGARFALVAVDGVSEQATGVERKASGAARFTFRFPEGARSVTFTSRWVSMRMQGAAAGMTVEFPIELPAAGNI